MFPRKFLSLYNKYNIINQVSYKVITTKKQFIPSLVSTLCKYSTQSPQNVATYEDIKNIKQDTVLIDVREPSELKETGTLPSSINIPMGDLESVFKLSGEEFKKKFGRPKPSADQEIIFSCKAGIRAEKAMNFVSSLGYKNTRFYQGSWTEWAEKSNK